MRWSKSLIHLYIEHLRQEVAKKIKKEAEKVKVEAQKRKFKEKKLERVLDEKPQS